MRVVIVCAGVAAMVGAALARPAEAQRQTIEIRGQVPTPQIVTVRPREVPEFSTQVLVPAFYDHQFWPVILPAYQIVSRNEVRGVMPTDSVAPVSGVAAPAGGAPAAVPQARPAGGADTAATSVTRPAVPPATQNEEIEALRRELELRRARLDSIDAARKRQLDSLEQAIRERQQQIRPDTTVRPPGTSPAPPR
jgi:hypothetical protein